MGSGISFEARVRTPTSGASSADPEPQVQNPVALDDEMGVLQEMLPVDVPEEALARTEDDGNDIHRYLVDQPKLERLATDDTGGNADGAAARQVLCGRDRDSDVVDEVVRRLGMPSVRLWSM